MTDRPAKSSQRLTSFITAPVGAHLMAKAALHVRVASRPALPSKRLDAPGWTNREEL